MNDEGKNDGKSLFFVGGRGRTMFDPFLTRFRRRKRNKRQKTFIVTTLVDYKIKSFEKRVARDKSSFERN